MYHDAVGRIIPIDNDNPVPVELQIGVPGAPGVTDDDPFPVSIGDIIRIFITPTITAGAYTAGDAIGGRLEFANAVWTDGGKGVIEKVVVVDRDQEQAPIDLVLFNQAFTATVDNAPFDPSDADLLNSLGYIDVAATDYADFSDNSVAAKASGLRMPFAFQLASGTILYGQMVVRSGPTYTATSDLTIILTIRRL
jgi:hypothetical protein